MSKLNHSNVRAILNSAMARIADAFSRAEIPDDPADAEEAQAIYAELPKLHNRMLKCFGGIMTMADLEPMAKAGDDKVVAGSNQAIAGAAQSDGMGQMRVPGGAAEQPAPKPLTKRRKAAIEGQVRKIERALARKRKRPSAARKTVKRGSRK